MSATTPTSLEILLETVPIEGSVEAYSAVQDESRRNAIAEALVCGRKPSLRDRIVSVITQEPSELDRLKVRLGHVAQEGFAPHDFVLTQLINAANSQLEEVGFNE